MKKTIPFLLGLLCLLTACTSQQEHEKPQVYTSFYAMYDFARAIAGEQADVMNLVPVGTEPHDWEPTAGDIAKLNKADLFIYNGNGMESWAEKVVSTLPKEVRSVNTSQAVSAQNQSDPHVWLNPENAREQAEAIRDALIAVDPEHESNYNTNYDIWSSKLNTLEKDYKQAVDRFSSKEIVVSHEAYGYLCQAYGLTQIAIEGLNGDSEPSPAKMAEIVTFVKERQIHYIFFEELGGRKVVDAIAKETGAQALVLNPFEGDIQERDYFTVMEENLKNLELALK